MEGGLTCRVLVVGDTGVGKTALITRFLGEQFLQEKELYKPSLKTTTVGCKIVIFSILEISDISNTGVNPAILHCDVLLLCYNISEPASLRSVINHWVPSLQSLAPSTPHLLIGCQADLRTDRAVVTSLANQGRSPVSSSQALRVSRQIGAVMYVETETKLSTKSAVSAFEVAALTCMGHFNIPAPPIKHRSRSVTTKHKIESTTEFWEKFRSPIPKRRWSTKSPARLHELSSTGIRSGSLGNLSLIRSKSSPLSDTNVISISTSSKPPRASRKTVRKDQTSKLKMIKCQRMTQEKTFEEIEIAVPESVYDNLENDEVTARHTTDKQSFGQKLRSFFLPELAGGLTE